MPLRAMMARLLRVVVVIHCRQSLQAIARKMCPNGRKVLAVAAKAFAAAPSSRIALRTMLLWT
jgi:hypothetical protein